MSQTILVTGGAGYIGSAVVDALVRFGHNVTVFDNLSTGQQDKVHPGAIFINGDITDYKAVQTLFTDISFDSVIHLAAKKSVGESEQNPALYFHTNVIGSCNLLSAMTEACVPRIIFSSTAAVYAPSKSDLPITENNLSGPVSVYGRTKLMVEDIIGEYCRTGKIKSYNILRYFNVAGDAGLSYIEQDAQNVFPILKNSLLSQTPFHIFGTDYNTRDGTCVRDYIHLTDLVDAHVKAIEFEGNEVFNIGTGTGYTVRELIEVFEKVSGKKVKVIESPRREGDVALVTASAQKAAQYLKWTPHCTLEEMVESTFIF